MIEIQTMDLFGRPQLTVRAANPGIQPVPFDAIWPTYLTACAAFGYRPQSRDKSAAFYIRTRGWGVLWSV